MERLTTRHSGVAVIKGKRFSEAARKLAVYEDAEEQKALKEQVNNLSFPCKLEYMIDDIFSHNEIVALWVNEPGKHLHLRVWRGMAWDIPKALKECEFVNIFGVVPETIDKADTINICIKLSAEAEKALAEMKGE